jgi:hypothetical protein
MANAVYTSTISSPLGGAQDGGFGSTSSSTSVPESINSAQTDWGLTQSQLLSALADRTYNWAMDQYARGSAVTDQTIQNFMEMSGKGKGLADTLLHQYQDQIKPLMDQYIREAGSYASEGRQRFEAGKAMSTVGQADQAAMDAIERKLESTGINVNSGRIQEQMIASRVADAAARAGAGTAAAQHTEDVGRQMTENALRMGQQIPGQAVGALQSAYAGLTGAENAILGLLNTGKNLADAAAPYHNAAVAANKVPPTGQNAKSESESRTPPPQGGAVPGHPATEEKGGGGGQAAPKEKEPKQPKPAAEGRGDGRGEGAGPKLGPPADTSGYGQVTRISGAGAGRQDDDEQATGAPAAEGYVGPLGYVDDTGTLYPEMSLGAGTTTWDQALSEPEVPNWTLPQLGERGYNAEGTGGVPDTWSLGGANIGATWDDALSNALPVQGGTRTEDTRADLDSFGGQNFQQYADRGDIASDVTGSEAYIQEDTRGGQDFSNYDGAEDDFSQNDYGGGYDEDTGGIDTYADSGDDYSDYDYSEADYGGGYDEDTGGYDDSDYGGSDYDYSGADYGGGYDDYYDAGGGYDDYSGGDYDYSQDDYGGGYEDYDYAQGGRVRSPRQRPMGRGVMPTTGGAVPRSASPSQGRQTDDISARLNAGEYVIPRDVVKHQGTKFFTDLIAKSRKLRTGMTGAKPGPTMRPALPQGRPTFRSRALPPR